MKSKLALAASVGALIILGVGVETFAPKQDSQRDSEREGAAFVNPLLVAGSICGKNADAPRARRAFFARIAAAQAKEPEVSVAAASAPAQFGSIGYPITTTSPLAQAHFNAGLAHVWNFNHGAAIDAFRAAQAADPECAMCLWGESFAYGPNINAPMAEDAAAPAYAALKRAQKAKGASEKEKALIAALSKRYVAKPGKDRSALDNAFAEAMDAVARAYPQDDFIAALAAEAIMDAQPWDYWEADGRTPKGRAARAMSLIESTLSRNPNHQASIHLYVHLTEATRDPYRAVRYADALADLSPGLGHLVHMPSHTYYRIGRFRQSLEVNNRAVSADEAFLAANKAHPMYEFGYYVHNVHFVMTSALMAGDSKTALAMAQKLDAKLPLAMASEVPFAQPIKAAPYYAYAQFGAPELVLALPDPGADLPFVQAAWRYARGEALARAGKAAEARAEAGELARILAEEDLSALEELNIPASDIIRIARLTVMARAAAADRDYAAAVAAMEEAVAAQDALAYTEPPYWYYPARQTLAAMALKNGEAERAAQLFIEALAETPNNGWALFGAAEAMRAKGDRAGEKYARALFKAAWAGSPRDLSLDRL